ncbi:hypothetical protein YB2330_000206 [Saitoella coloradoensis]
MDKLPYPELSKPAKYQRRAMMVYMDQQGKPKKEIMEQCKVARTPLRDITNLYKETGSYEDRERSGRPKKYSERDERKILRNVRSGNAKDAVDASAQFNHTHQNQLSSKIICRILKRRGGKAIRKPKKPFLNQKARKV